MKPQPEGSYTFQVRGDVWRSPDGRAWELLPGELLSVSKPGMGCSLAYGFKSVGDLGGRPLIVGTVPDGGITLWLGPASIQ